ncbi:MAG: bifunctional oligoribonuclease/PAP phosphatase NrnA [Candidatus Aminicenantes bacterium]|nr:bifunctional oligoribonuclease/PAP phosphatase NrnA [Candidatus Aminicenantes bacterium]
MKKKVAEAIRKAKKIALSSHVRPDADCIGSALALYLMLEQLGKDVSYYNTDSAPFPLTSLPAYDVIRPGQVYPQHFDILILIEGGTEDRTGLDHIEKYFTINIDHHATSAYDSNLNWVDPSVSAVGELIYELGIELGIEFTRDIGFNLYAAISSDSGSFKYSNTTHKSLWIASQLVKDCNFSPYEVSDLLFYSNHLEKVGMMEKVLSTLELRLNNKVAFIDFKREFLTTLSLKDIETEDVISVARSILGVEATLFFKEIEDNFYRISIRSRGRVSSQKVAKAFKGGGHDHAAGFFYKGSIEKAKDEIVAVIKKQLV